jgi:uncharacterized membrane protein
MKAIQHQIEINWPVKALFNYVSDLSNNAEWQRQVVNAEWIGVEKNRSGAQFKETRKIFGLQLCATAEVTEFQLYKKRSFAVLNGPIRPELTMEFEPRGEHTVMKLTIAIRTKGFMRLVEGVMARHVTREGYNDLVRLKELLETSN